MHYMPRTTVGIHSEWDALAATRRAASIFVLTSVLSRHADACGSGWDTGE
jgi:hypothetical protein